MPLESLIRKPVNYKRKQPVQQTPKYQDVFGKTIVELA